MVQHLPLFQQNESEIEILQEMSPVLSHSGAFFSGRMPVPPGVNQSYQIVKNPGPGGGMRLADTSEYAAFKEAAAWELKLANVDWELVEVLRFRNRSSSKWHVPLFVRIRCFFKHMWQQDLDGVEKAVIDAAFRHIELDDRYVVGNYSTKEMDSDDPHIEVEIYCVLPK